MKSKPLAGALSGAIRRKAMGDLSLLRQQTEAGRREAFRLFIADQTAKWIAEHGPVPREVWPAPSRDASVRPMGNPGVLPAGFQELYAPEGKRTREGGLTSIETLQRAKRREKALHSRMGTRMEV